MDRHTEKASVPMNDIYVLFQAQCIKQLRFSKKEKEIC